MAELEDPLAISEEERIKPSYMEEKDYKKDEMSDYDYMLSQNQVAYKTEEAEFSSLFHVEPKLEVLEDRVVIAHENPDGLELYDDSNDEATVVDNDISRPDRYSKDEELASSYGLPVSVHDIVELPITDLNKLLKLDSLSELQREVARKIRRRGKMRAAGNAWYQRRKTEGPILKLKEKRLFEHDWIQNSFITPKCILCENYPSTIYGYTAHLYQAHNSSLKLNEICLLCSCGVAVCSYNRRIHNKKCAGIEFSLHKLEEYSWYSPPQCVLCKNFPSSIYEYTSHLFKSHNTTPCLNNVFLLCSCGTEVHSIYNETEHKKECDGIEFSVCRVQNPISKPSQCILCEKYPRTAYSYAQHLASHHQSSLNANRIYLRCSCGHQIRSSTRSIFHGVMCDARKFTIEKDHPMNHDHCYSWTR